MATRVEVIRYDDKVMFSKVYDTDSWAKAIKLMENEFKFDKWIVSHIHCEDVKEVE